MDWRDDGLSNTYAPALIERRVVLSTPDDPAKVPRTVGQYSVHLRTRKYSTICTGLAVILQACWDAIRGWQVRLRRSVVYEPIGLVRPISRNVLLNTPGRSLASVRTGPKRRIEIGRAHSTPKGHRIG